MIIVKNIRKPGMLYDSTKYNELATKITAFVRNIQDGQYWYSTETKIKGQQLWLSAVRKDKQTGKISSIDKGKQQLLSGRITNFLQSNGIVHDIEVR